MAAVLEELQSLGAQLLARMSYLEAQMANLGPALDRLENAVRNINLSGSSEELQRALAAERAANAALLEQAAQAESTRLALAVSEDEEDVVQNADLQSAVDAVNAAQAETDSAAGRIDAAATTLEGYAAPAEPTDPGTDPVVDEPAPVDPPVDTDPGTNPVDPTVPVTDPGEPDPNAPVFPPNQ